MKKNIMLRTAVLTAVLTAAFGMTAFAAGRWEKDATGYWWQEEDGSYPVSCWKWLDWNNDGLEESYYFDANGYMAANTTVDDYTVNADGAWVVDGVVQTRPAEAQAPAPAEQAETTDNGQAVSDLEKFAGKYELITHKYWTSTRLSSGEIGGEYITVNYEELGGSNECWKVTVNGDTLEMAYYDGAPRPIKEVSEGVWTYADRENVKSRFMFKEDGTLINENDPLSDLPSLRMETKTYKKVE